MTDGIISYRKQSEFFTAGRKKDMSIDKVTETLGLGVAIEEPKEVKGGLLHKMYRVATVEGVFAVKALNPEIMKRPSALRNTINSEKAAAAFSSIIPAVASCSIQGRQIHEIDGRYYMIFKWVEGRSVFPPDIKKEHCKIIGDILGKMHRFPLSLAEIQDREDACPMYEWDKYLQTAKEREVREEDWVLTFERSIKDIIAWNKAACDAQEELVENMVISHRDLDPKNVLWDGLTPFVIDWEAAGYVNPYQELLEVINYWADDGNGSLNNEYYDVIIKAYERHMSLEDVRWEKVFAGSYAGMLGWLAYNIRRALGIEAADEEEVRLGKEQVKETINALYDHRAKAGFLRERDK